MAEVLIGLFITIFLNGLWHTKDPTENPRYWDKDDNTTIVWQEMDSTFAERAYVFKKQRRKKNKNIVVLKPSYNNTDSLLLDGL